jgi:hypothetical protein
MDEMVKVTMNAKMKNDRLCNAKALLVSYAGLAGTLALKEQIHKSPASGAWRLEINEVSGPCLFAEEKLEELEVRASEIA